MRYDWYPDTQVSLLVSLCPKVREIEGMVIEIGCWEGKSTIALANACFPETLYCNDTWLGNQAESSLTGVLHNTEVILKEYDVFSAFTNNMNTQTKGNYTVVKKDCMLWLKEIKGPIKLCHVDASHDYDSVKQTLELLRPLMAPNGIICGDDFINSHAKRVDLKGGVERAVREILPTAVNDNNFWWWVNE